MSGKQLRRVAVTGVGIVSPVGNNAADFFNNLMTGRPGVRRLTADFAGKLSNKIAAEVDLDPTKYFSKTQLRFYDRAAQLALVAASQAWSDSGLSLSDKEKKRSGVYMGIGMGGARSVDEVSQELYKKDAPRISPLSVVKIMANAPASHISIHYGLFGPCLTFSTACSSSAVAIGEAYLRIRSGSTDVMVAGGAESLISYGSFRCWESLWVLALEDPNDPAASCKPFSKDRTGFVLGEGAAVLILEEMERAVLRGAGIYGELIGYGTNSDACHITAPSVEGQSETMRLALEDAGITSDEVDYINAHGSATAANDVVETRAIKNVFGERAYKIPVSSTKSMHGHLMGAGGAVEFTAALLSIKNSAIPPTANLKTPDPECDLDYVPEGRRGVKVRTVMSNSFAFGGTNAVLIARK